MGRRSGAAPLREREKEIRAAMADAGRRRAEAEFSYEKLAERLGRAIDAMVTR